MVMFQFIEPGLAELVHRNKRDGRLQFTTDLAQGIEEAEIIFIAVGTPQDDKEELDWSGVWEVGRQLPLTCNHRRLL